MRALAILLLWAGPARAQDYALDSLAWNGLSGLTDEIQRAGCPVSAPPLLDWSALGKHDVLWLIYPQGPVDGARLKKHLAAGGRALIADDFGSAADALASLEIQPARGPFGRGVPRFKDNPNLPIAAPELKTELGRAADEIVTNHPARFQSQLPASYGFADGSKLVIEGQVGTGYFVALSDPSVLINNMLELDGNRAFAQALVKRLCQSGDRVLVYSHQFISRGDPPGEGSPFSRFNQMLAGMNGAIKDDAAAGRGLTTLAVLLSVLGLVLLGGSFPVRAAVADDWARFERLLDREDPGLIRPGGIEWDYSLPAGVVRDEAVERVGALLEVSVERMGPSELERRLRPQLGDEPARRAAELWRELHRLGWRPGERPVEAISARRFRRMHELATMLFDALAMRHNRS